MFIYGQKCPLCGEAIAHGQPVFSTWGVWLSATDPMHEFCDAAMHWACYSDWERRHRFASSYFDFWVAGEERNVFWHRAYLDDEVLVTVNPAEQMKSSWVHLRSTGSRISVKLVDWQTWLAVGPNDGDHPTFTAAVAAAKERLRSNVPTSDALVAGVDYARKAAVFEQYRAAEKERRERRRRPGGRA